MSPDFNLIEQPFASFKSILRKAAARTLDALIDAMALALTGFNRDECANHIAKSGYRHQS